MLRVCCQHTCSLAASLPKDAGAATDREKTLVAELVRQTG